MVNEIVNIVKKVSSLTEEELQDRLTEMRQQAKDLDDLGLNPDAGFQFEAMMILSRLELLEQPVEGLDDCTSENDDDLVKG